MLIVGEREAAEGMVSVRRHGKGDVGSLPLDEFVAQFKEESRI
jgi:threonyl-tRNA synthetase